MFGKNTKFQLTEGEILLAVVFALIGFFLSLRDVVVFLSSLNPIAGLLVYYIILYASLYILSRLDLTIFGLKIDKPIQVFGLTMITFAFFILVNWESAYINLVVNGSSDNVSNLYFASEDGAVWFLWYDVIGIKDLEISRILTYCVSPFILALFGGLLLDKKITLGKGDMKWWGRK